MYSAEEHRQMTGKLLYDRPLNKIDDRFARMRFLVEQRSDKLARYRQWVMTQCEEYEREHRKSIHMADYYLVKAGTWFERFAERSQRVTDDQEEAYKELIRVSNNALRYMSYDWEDARSMARLAELYVNRAKVEVGREEHKLALSNLQHAYAVVRYFKDDQIEEHFGVDLLASMVSLGAELQEQLNISGQDKFLGDLKKNPCIDIDTSLIEKMHSAFEVYQASHTKDEFKGNFQLNQKLRLVTSEQGGRFYQATAHILPEEHILHDRGQSVAIFANHRFDYCDYCHRKMDVFWPCSACCELGYCSARCAQEAWSEYHRFECGIYGLILGTEDYYWMAHVYRHYITFGHELTTRCESQETAAENGGEPFDLNEYLNSQELQTVPSCELSSKGRELLCRAFTSLQSNRGKRSLLREHAHTILAAAMVQFFIHKGFLKEDVLQDVLTYSRLLENLSAAMMRICTNGFCWAENIDEKSKSFTKVASCICLAASFLNHSCDANVNWAITDSGLITMNASRAIQPGESLTTCYGPKKYNNFGDRQERLFSDYCFYCRCDVCMKDAANTANTLKCLANNGTCRGPLVLNQFNACLECGQVTPSKLSNVAQIHAQKASAEFNRLIQKLYSKKTSAMSCISALNCAKGFTKKRFTRKAEESEEEISQRLQAIMATTSEPVTMAINPAYFSLRRVAALEKHLKIYSDLIYEGSYHLLEKCVFMLKVYHDCNLNDRGLHLLEPIARSLQNVTPSLTNASLSKLLYMLDYAAYFYENFAIAHECNIPCLVKDDNTSIALSSLQMNSIFWSFNEQLNTKLASILQYDMEQRGHFFPTAYRRLRADLKEEDQTREEDTTNTLNAEEQYNAKLYSECQRRLAFIEQVANSL